MNGKLLLWSFLLYSGRNYCQRQDSLNMLRVPVNNTRMVYKPEILTSGFIDVLNTGQVSASARFIRIFIGEPGKFSIPLSIYSGVSSNNFQNQQLPGGQRSNEQLGSAFINPLAGLINFSLEGILFFRNRYNLTNTGLLYHAGMRILTGYKTSLPADPSSGRPINFINTYSSGGMYFQTGAWEKNNSKNMGICWFAGRYILCKSGKTQLSKMIGLVKNGFYHGWSAGWGIEINNLVNIKLVFYKYVNAPETDFTEPIYQFSFTYSLK